MANSPGKNPYSLSIRVFADGFSLFIHDENLGLSSFKHLQRNNSDSQSEFTELFSQKELNSSFSKTRLIIETGDYSLIPDQFGTDGKALLTLQHPYLPDDNSVIINHIDGHGMSVIFTLQAEVLKAFRNIFPDIIPQLHLNTFLLQPPESGRVILWNRNREIDMILFHEGKLLLMNSFSISTFEDIIYYTLNLYREFGLNRHDFPLWFYNSGQANQNQGFRSDISEGLKSFFGNVNIQSQTTHYENYQRYI